METSPDTKIRFEHVTKEYRSDSRMVTAVKDLTIEVRDEEFLVVVGPSGCGKSTMLNMIAGFDSPSSGTITLNGHEVTGPGPDRGFVFQDFALYPWRTVLRNVSFGLEAQGVPKEQALERARRYIEHVGLKEFEDAYPHTLSGGMKQRVGIARAMVYKPDVLLMDEPFVALDAQTRNTLQCELVRVWQNNKSTIIFITHNVDEAVFLGDRIAVMTKSPGQIREIVDVPLKRPRDRTTPEFNAIRKEVLALLNYDDDCPDVEGDELHIQTKDKEVLE
jgi:NitT/TauT family transport system ATP-binding protein